MDDDDDYDDEEKEEIAPLGGNGSNLFSNMAKQNEDMDNKMSNLSVQEKQSSMPMPPGLLPTGSFMPQKKAPAPKQPQSNALAKLRAQYEPLEWSAFFDSRDMIDDKIPIYTAGTEGHIFFCLHGAGHSALSFATLAAELKKRGNTCISFDWRGHGGHFCEDE